MRLPSARAQALRAPADPGDSGPHPAAYFALIHLAASDAGGAICGALEAADALPDDLAGDSRAVELVVALDDAHAACARAGQLASRIRATLLGIAVPTGLRLVDGGAV
jgi:hypothetical protein